jgi:hypothetical protein
LLELVTGIAFTDTPKTMGTMSACRSILNFFNSSTQVMIKQISKEVEGRAVKQTKMSLQGGGAHILWWNAAKIEDVLSYTTTRG